jgi:hypothetical protein
MRLVLLAMAVCAGSAQAGVLAAPSTLPEYMLFAQRRLDARVTTPTFHGNVGVNCPFTPSGCGFALFDRASLADGTALVADRIVPRLPGGSVFRAFGTLDDPGGLLEIRDPGPNPDGTHPFLAPILPDLDGDGAPSCDADCTTDPGDLARACGFAEPFPNCDIAVRVIARRNRDCSAGVDLFPGNGRCDLAPGVYGEVTVRGKATMLLAGGVYTMCGFDVGKRGELLSSAPALVNIDGGDVVVKRRGGIGRQIGEIVIHKRGIGKVRVDPLGSLRGRVCAPEALITLGRLNRPGPILSGQFVGDVITVDGDFTGGASSVGGAFTCETDADCNAGDVCGASSCIECEGCELGFDLECCSVTGGNYCSELVPQPCHCELEGESCDDENACTLSDTCDASLTCAGTETLLCDDGNGCTDDGCDPEAGCTFTPNSAGCDDGDACTENDTCGEGSCQPGTPVDCDDGIDCTVDSCDAEAGCIHTPVGCACDEDADCEDGDPCTENTCDTELHECESAPAACECDEDADCEDGDPCTENTCDPDLNVCQSTPVECTTCGEDLDCDDDNPCTTSACDPELDVCVHTPVADGTSCADDDACDGEETCTAGECGAGPPLVCDDGNPCTTDTCDAGGCTSTPLPDGTVCTDGDACNGDEVCSGGSCVSGTVPTCFAALACAFAADLELGTCPEKMKTRFDRARALGEAGRGRALDGKDKAAGKRLKKAFRVLRKMAKRAALLEACGPVTARAEAARDVVAALRADFDGCVAELRNGQ